MPSVIRSLQNLAGTMAEAQRQTSEKVGGERFEVNIWGSASLADGSSVRIVGEAKTQLASKHFKKFDGLLKGMRPAYSEKPFLLFVTSQAEPEVLKEAEARGIAVVFSFELETARDQRLISELKRTVAG